MRLKTRLTEYFDIDHPVVLAPMDYVADARLADAVSAAGGLGLLGGGYTDETWLREQFTKSTQPLGCGFITWTLRGNEQVLEYVLSQRPSALFLSFADPAPYADTIRAAGVPLICQVHNLEQATHAIDIGADVLVAQGGEAGGHGVGDRSTFTLVPEIVDLAARMAPHVLVLAAGGVVDGRSLAAALTLGADGVLVGTRFWASQEAAIARSAQLRAMQASGDDTIRQRVYDIVRGKAWPRHYSGRVLHNDFVRTWHNREDQLAQQLPQVRAEFQAAVHAQDYTTANMIIGEGIGLIQEVQPVADIMHSMVSQAHQLLSRTAALV
ncbi:NAD(P)H-dependent flavin oxidoreductase [Mycolicibacterium smegmatis]|uniref:Oxidoreductase, 2-nitropropane dioxygenase family protein n=1 Tax=Mycolicibacterium smegmatis (strain MKD8) TaxID=1214915 RepID=A0A2U9Q0R8_MYCSE|nr:nitronate monooxygenase [Mycolicibacterium smegmatis]AWT57652.1 oxidoreductase, 2-nitropropane dioxygenase family protein [Mycolicibacterium smegmatis MKD8]